MIHPIETCIACCHVQVEETRRRVRPSTIPRTRSATSLQAAAPLWSSWKVILTSQPVLGIRISMFLGLPDQDPFSILWNLWLQEKGSQEKNYFLLLFFVDIGIQDIDPWSEIRDPGWEKKWIRYLSLLALIRTRSFLFFEPNKGRIWIRQ